MALLHTHNLTPFAWTSSEKMAPGHRVCDIVIVKCSVPLAPSLDAAVCKPQQAQHSPIHMADMGWQSELGAYAPLRVAGDVVLFKPATDVLITGEALPQGSQSPYWPAQINVKTTTELRQQTLLLHAPRQWCWSLLKGWQLVYTDATHSLPLRYEQAYGGSYRDKDEWHYHEANPAGRGWLPVNRLDTHVHYEAAQIELRGDPLKHIEKPIATPALGPIARPWDLRSQYAGTYDQQWQAQAPHPELGWDYPQDFDLRFFQAAAPGLVFTPHFSGGEAIELLGLADRPALYGQIPRWQPKLALRGPLRSEPYIAPMRLDTVEIDLEEQRLHLLWRSSLPQEQRWQQAIIGLVEDAA